MWAPTKEQEGFAAYSANLGLSSNPYSIYDGRDEWSRGWFQARELFMAAWRKIEQRAEPCA